MRFVAFLLLCLFVVSCQKAVDISTVAPVLKDFTIPVKTYGDTPFDLIPPVSESDGAITYSTDNANIISISGKRVTILKPGICNVIAKQAATSKYKTASISAVMTVQSAGPALSDFTIANKTTNDKPFVITAPKSNSTGAFKYYSSTPAVATISGNTITIAGQGKTTITAVQEASGNYASAQITGVLTVTYEPPLVTDFDGNTYQTVVIGTQTWMVGNLKTTHYNDGVAISNVTDASAWNALTTGAYCYFNNDNTTTPVFGKLYNWYAVTSTHQLAPAGWHVPTDADWLKLYNFLGGTRYTGFSIMDPSGNWFGAGATNTTGFSAFPAGYRGYLGYIGFGGSTTDGVWWSTTEVNATTAWMFDLYTKGYVERIQDLKTHGFSVRCVKD